MTWQEIVAIVFRPFVELHGSRLAFSWEGLADLVFHIGFYGFFLTCFFFYYATIVEQQIVQEQTYNLVSNVSSSINALAPELYKQFTDNLEAPALTDKDENTCKENRKLKNNSLILFGSIFGGTFVFATLFVVVYFATRGRFGLKPKELGLVIYINVIIIALIAVSEYAFLTFFARNFRTLDPNFVKEYFTSALLSRIQNTKLD